jgi:hypothetical protein
VTRVRDPLDLLAYGSGELADLTRRWPESTARAGVEVALPAGFSLARHAGPLEVQLRVRDENAFCGAAGLRQQGALDAEFELYLEPLSPAPEGEGLRDVPVAAARRIRRATFCAVFTLWANASAPSCIAAFFAAAGLVRAGQGELIDLEEDIYWTANEALAHADDYLGRVLGIADRAHVEPTTN